MFSDGSAIDTTNSTSFVGTPLSFCGGGGCGGGFGGGHSCAGGGCGGGLRGFGGGCNAGCERRVLSFTGALSNSTNISSYVIFNLGSLTFAVIQWYMIVGFLFLALVGWGVYKRWIR